MDIPVNVRYSITPEQAADMFDLPIGFIRRAGALTKEHKFDFPCHYVGTHLKIHREQLGRWMDEHIGADFKTMVLLETEEGNTPCRGRPRKVR